MNLLRDILSNKKREPAPEQRAMQVTPWGDWGGSYGSSAGMNVSTDSALQLLTVYGATTLIADTIATLPRDVFRKRDDGTNEEVANPPRWLEQPNPDTDIIEFLTQTLSSLLLDGNAYWAYGIDGNLQPSVMYVLNPTEVDVRVGQSRLPAPEYWIRGERYRGRLLHIKGVTRPGCVKGLSPVEAARQSLGVGLAEQEFHGNFYKNGATLSAVVEVPGAMTQEQARDLRENISRSHGGVANAHLPGVITNGGKWNTVSVTPEQAEFLASRKYDDGAICSRMFLLDPTWLGIPVEGQSLTYANLEQRGIHLAQFTLMRWIVRVERAVTFLLPRPQFLKLNVNALQRADLKTRMEAHRIALGPNEPFELVNEVREFEDLPPVPGGDTFPAKPTPVAPVPPQQPPVVNNHIGAPITHVASPPVPEVHFYAEAPKPSTVTVMNTLPFPDLPAPVVHNHVSTPTVNVAAPKAPDVRVNVEQSPPANVTVNVPKQRVPDVHVDAPVVTVAPPEVHNHIDAPKTVRKRVIRNEEDRIVAVEETSE